MKQLQELLDFLRCNGIKIFRIIGEERVLVIEDGIVFCITKQDDFGWQRWASSVAHLDYLLRVWQD
jgi:hypothetical protein